MKTNAIRMYEYGGPEVMRYEEVELAEPGEGEARIRHTAIGLNFIDTYHRTGLYPMDLPTGLGSEAAGIVRGRGARGKRGAAWKSRGLHGPACRLIFGMPQSSGMAAGAGAGRCLRRAGGGGHAQRTDGLVPAAEKLIP